MVLRTNPCTPCLASGPKGNRELSSKAQARAECGESENGAGSLGSAKLEGKGPLPPTHLNSLPHLTPDTRPQVEVSVFTGSAVVEPPSGALSDLSCHPECQHFPALATEWLAAQRLVLEATREPRARCHPPPASAFTVPLM